MGKARIISGGPTGRYTIELDYGSAIKTAALAALATVAARVDADALAAQVLVDEADSKETAQRLVIADVETILIDSMQSGTPAGSPELADVNKLFQFEVYQLRQLQQAHIILRLRLQAIKAEKTLVTQRVAYWNNFEPLETRDAWCTDYTIDGAASAQVGTIDIPGESNLLLIAPGCRAPIASDGALQAREVMSPAQAYFNAAILPGWQKFQPTYRWGTITAIDYDADTASVTIASAISSAQSLNVNQGTALVAVPVDYLDCNADAFEVGDRCVVKFAGQDWDAPTVIGFLDNPRPCIRFPSLSIKYTFATANITDNANRAWIFSAGFNEQCGVIALGTYGEALTAQSATHSIKVTSVALSGSPAGFAFTCSASVGNVLFSDSSTAFQMSTSRVPASNDGTSVGIIWDTTAKLFSVVKATAVATTQTYSGNYTLFCEAQEGPFTGGLWSSTNGVNAAYTYADVISSQAFESWLASISAMPVVTVTYEGDEYDYRFKEVTSIRTNRNSLNDADWVVVYELDV